MRSPFLVYFLMVSTALALVACTSTPRRRYSFLREPSPPAVVDEKALLAELDLSPDNVGYLVYDTERQKVVAAKNPQGAFLPASVGKVPTTIASLAILGAQHRFPTTLAVSGGNLYLRGGGDPLLTTSDLMELAEALKRKNSRAFAHFYFDATELDERPRVHPLQDEDAVYNTSVAALSTDFNRLALNWRADPKAGALEAYFVPSLMVARAELSAQKSDAPGFSYREDPAGDIWQLPLDLSREGKKELPVHRGSLFTAELFAQLCAQEGVVLPAPEAGKQPPGATVLYTHWSAPLAELVSRNLEWSNNLMAELLLLSTAKKLAGTSLAPVEAASRLAGWWRKIAPHAPWSGFVVENGSGLSPNARLSPSQAVAMLTWADRHTFSGHSYLSLMPISGLKGTLHKRLDGPPTALRVWAKTGTMKFGSSLAGYFFSRSNHKHVFALFVSDLNQRQALDEAAQKDPLAFRKLSDEGENWIDRARRLQDGLLTRWILEN